MANKAIMLDGEDGRLEALKTFQIMAGRFRLMVMKIETKQEKAPR